MIDVVQSIKERGIGFQPVDRREAFPTQSEHSGLSLILTDLYPNSQVAESIESSRNEWLRYETTPINAANVPSELAGLRTMICSLHHMRPEVAKGILQDASAKKQPFLAFEIIPVSAFGISITRYCADTAASAFIIFQFFFYSVKRADLL